MKASSAAPSNSQHFQRSINYASYSKVDQANIKATIRQWYRLVQ